MRRTWVRRGMIAGVAIVQLLALPALAAPPVCGRAACREEIQACIDNQCEGLRGRDFAQCRKDCVEAVQSACDADATVCNPNVSTTTESTTTSIESTTSSSSSTSTTLFGSPSGVFVE